MDIVERINVGDQVKSILGNTISLISARGFAIVISSLNFIIVARFLGIENFGIYASTIAILGIIFPLATFGAPLVIVQRHSEKYGFLHLARYFRLILSGAVFSYAATLFVGRIILPFYSWEIVLFVTLLFISEIILNAGHEIFFAMYQAANKIYLSVPYSVALVSLRLGCNFFLVIISNFNLITFAAGYAIVSLSVLYFYWYATLRNLNSHFEGDNKKLPPLKKDLMLGAYFSFSMLSKSIYTDIDKTMLPRLASLSSTGLYSAAYRIMQMAFVPLISFFKVIYPQYFKKGKTGKQSIIQFLAKIFPWTLGYGILATLILFFSAPVIPYILGQEYTGASTMLRWLSPVIFLQGVYYPLADALTGLRRQSLRTKIQVVVLFFNIILNLILIPRIGWLGAAITTLVSESALILGMFTGLILLRESNNRRL